MNTTVSKAVAAHTTSGMAVIVLLWLAQTYGHLAMPDYVAVAIVGLFGTFVHVVSHARFVQAWFAAPTAPSAPTTEQPKA